MEEKLSRLVKTGYPYVKEGAGLASWVLPEYGFNRMIDQAGDRGIARLAEPLGLGDSVSQLLERSPNQLEVLPVTWQEAVRKWPPLTQVGQVVAAFQEISGLVTAHLNDIKPLVDPMVVCRSLAVLLVAPFVSPGREFLTEVAGILGKPADSPAELIRSYGQVVCRGDIVTLEKVNRCVEKSRSLSEWSAILQAEVLKCQYIPKLVAVTPPLSPDLVNVLAQMIKEAGNADAARNN